MDYASSTPSAPSLESGTNPGGIDSSLKSSSSSEEKCTQYTHTFDISPDGKNFTLTSITSVVGLPPLPPINGNIVNGIPTYEDGKPFSFICEKKEWDQAWADYISKHPGSGDIGSGDTGSRGPGSGSVPIVTSLGSAGTDPSTLVCLQVTPPGATTLAIPPVGSLAPVPATVTVTQQPQVVEAQVLPDNPTGDLPIAKATAVGGGKLRQKKILKGGAECFSKVNLNNLSQEELENLQKYINENTRGGKTRKRKNKKRITKKQKRKRNNTKRKYNNKYGKFSIRKKSKLRRHSIRNKK